MTRAALRLDHDERAITLLRGDVDMWRALAERWIATAIDYQLRWSAAERVVREQIDELTAAALREQRLLEERDDARAVFARHAERMRDDDA